MVKHTVIIYWCSDDNVFIAEMLELKGCIAHGDTKSEALKKVNKVAKEWLLMAKEKGWLIPEAKGKLIYA